MRKRTVRAHIANSTIPNSGKGLFASVPITKMSIISEFKGTIRASNEDVVSNRSLIRFGDNHYLECKSNDLASFTNDPIMVPTVRRKLLETLESAEPFYRMHPMACNNAYIKLNEKSHRAFLVAVQDIPKDAEIFCHYGFSYWFMTEFCKGFLYEERLDINGFPTQLYNYPAFKLYVSTFYPTFSEFKVVEYETGETDVIICYGEATAQTVIHLDNYSSMMRKAPLAPLSSVTTKN